MSALETVLKAVWRAPEWMAPNERPQLRVDERPYGPATIRLSSHRVTRDGDVITSSYRHAVVPFLLDERNYHDRSGTIRQVTETVDYLSRLVFPRPLPRFRIRRDLKRLTK